jgi:drug/metabolite transporter (DMT)-like permease
MLFPVMCILTASLLWMAAAQMFGHLSRTTDVVTINLYKVFLSVLYFGVTLLVWGGHWPNLKSTLCFMASGVMGLAVADIIMFYSFAKIGTARSLMVSSLGPSLIGVLAWFLLSRPTTPLQAAGLLCLMFCLFTLSQEYPDRRRAQTKFLLMAVAAYSIEATGVVMTKMGFELDTSVQAVEACFLRGIGGGIAMLVIAAVRHKKDMFRKGQTIPLKAFMGVCFIGSFLNLLIYLHGLKMIPQPAVAAGLGSMTPVYASIYEHWRDKQWPTRKFLLAVLFMILGAGTSVYEILLHQP